MVLETKNHVSRPTTLGKAFLKGFSEVGQGDREERITFVFPSRQKCNFVALHMNSAMRSYIT
jgi:hypothetical protein